MGVIAAVDADDDLGVDATDVDDGVCCVCVCAIRADG
jgi:hypothetical protein